MLNESKQAISNLGSVFPDQLCLLVVVVLVFVFVLEVGFVTLVDGEADGVGGGGPL